MLYSQYTGFKKEFIFPATIYKGKMPPNSISLHRWRLIPSALFQHGYIVLI